MNPAGEYVYLNGSILPASEAAISPFDAGLLRGYAVFDVLQTIDGAPYMLPAHLARFRSSADQLGLMVPVSDEEIERIIVELLARNGHPDAMVRLVLTGGYSPDGMHFDPSAPTFYILTHKLFNVPAEYYTRGARLLTVKHSRELPHVKTTNYLTWLLNHPRIEAEGAIDLLYHDGRVISEAATASVYVVRGGAILAPAGGVLPGTVGNKVLELAAERFEVRVGEVTLDDLFSAEECFLTSTTRGVVPITRVDDAPIGTGEVGPVTRELMVMYRDASVAGG